MKLHAIWIRRIDIWVWIVIFMLLLFNVVLQIKPKNVTAETVAVLPMKQQVSIEKKININTATKEELDQLIGIGPAIADRIIAYREHNPFTAVEELEKVKGISSQVIEKNRDQIIVE